MSDQKQTEPLGNSPYLHFEEPGPLYDMAMSQGKPEDIAVIQAQGEELRNRIYESIEHDETGLDTERVSSLLGSYGLSLKPFIAITEDQIPKLEQIVGGLQSEEGSITGEYVRRADLVYVIRRRDLEAANGTGITESVLVHEQAHANTTLHTVAYAKDGDSVRSILLRGGFSVADDTENGTGSYYEEGFAAMLAHRYVIETLDKPNGFSEWGGAQIIANGSEKFKIPRNYFFPTSIDNTFGGTDTPSFAAYGMELMISKDPAILDAVLKARTSTEGLREFAKRVESLHPGLYRLLADQPYKLNNFMAATNYVIGNLYEGDQDKAIEAVVKPELVG